MPDPSDRVGGAWDLVGREAALRASRLSGLLSTVGDVRPCLALAHAWATWRARRVRPRHPPDTGPCLPLVVGAPQPVVRLVSNRIRLPPLTLVAKGGRCLSLSACLGTVLMASLQFRLPAPLGCASTG